MGEQPTLAHAAASTSHANSGHTVEFVRRYPQLFRDGVGCFLPEIVEDLPFVSEPDTSRLRQGVFSARMRTAANQQIEEWVHAGIIRPVAYTPKAVTPILLVPKPHSSDLRLCLDFRLINSCCKQVHSPPIDRHALIADLPRRHIFSTIDISSAFTCIRLASHLQEFFGIQFDGCYYVFTRLPFGYHNSMHFFLRAIQFTLARVRPHLPSDATIVNYVDDICVATDTIASHHHVLGLLFAALQEDGWTIKQSKCHLFQPEVHFLGIRYSHRGIEPDPGILDKIARLPLPTCSNDLRSVFGLAICLARFNYKTYEHLVPLRDYIKAGPRAFQTPEFKKKWETCINNLCQHVWASTPLDLLSADPMTLFVDSSKVAHGAVLFQGHNLVTMWSALNKRPHASSAESEITGLVQALLALKPYLVGVPFTVMTDNRAVISSLNPDNQSDIVKRQLDVIQYWFGDQCRIQHVPGANNHLADLLSRARYLSLRRGSEEVPRSGTTLGHVHASNVARPSEGEIRRRLDHAHFGHWSQHVTLQNLLMEYGRWPNIEQDVKEFVEQCENCAFSGEPQIRDAPPTACSRQPGDKVHMDHAGPYFDGSYILVMVDDATKWVETRRVPSTAARHALEALQHWLDHWGPIMTLCVDNASAWNSDSFMEWTGRRGIVVRHSPSYYHAGNALAERTIQTLLHRMRRMLNGSTTHWPQVIGAATFAINTSWNSTIRSTPQLLMKGQDRSGTLVEKRQYEEAWKRALENACNRKIYERERFLWKHPRRSKEFQTGDIVLLQKPPEKRQRLGKLATTWRGPFKIVRRESRSTWTIRNMARNDAPLLAHSSQMKPYLALVRS